MIISLIAAMGKDRVIGINNRLPWRLPADMKHFRAITMGKPVLMGRKTFVSIGRPLPGRTNIVVSQDPDFHPEGVTVARSIAEALTAGGNAEEIMVIGGASFYTQLLPRAQRLYLTEIHHRFTGDAFFPAWNRNDWHEIEREDHNADDENVYPYSFITLARQDGSLDSGVSP
jgi:dihydrofolate reductase